MKKMIKKQLGDYSYGILTSESETILFDTVPETYASAYFDSALSADTLILCDANPFPETVKKFLEYHPDGTVIATPYILYSLKSFGIQEFRQVAIRNDTVLCIGDVELSFRMITSPGKIACLTVDAGSFGRYEGQIQEPAVSTPVTDQKNTVVIGYLSGLNYTEWMARILSQSILDTGDLTVKLFDLAGEPLTEVLPLLKNAFAVMIGVPTAQEDMPTKVRELFSLISTDMMEGKYGAAFGSYTFADQGVVYTSERLRQLKMNVYDSLSIQFQPDQEMEKHIYEYGYSFGCHIQNKPNTRRSRLVKCQVCGEIFDSSLGTCPVCGAGLDRCVPIEEEKILFKKDTDLRYLIAGGGIAALSAAEAIRKRDATGKITMVSAEELLPYNRTMLTKKMTIAAKLPDQLALKPESWYQENNILVLSGRRIEKLDPVGKNVMLEDGNYLLYDRLVYAMGAECFVPRIPGRELDGVFTIRHFSDVKKIDDRLIAARSAVVIGGGVLGLEAAAELKKARLQVTVLESESRIMSRQLDIFTSQQLSEDLETCGIKIYTDVTISAITGNSHVTGIRLSDGTCIPADFVVISCGNRANSSIAENAGISVGRAILADVNMQTNVKDIYVCGDCAEYNGTNYQLWSEAKEQGRIAGANAAGDCIAYEGPAYGTSFEAMGISLFAIGDVGKEEKECKIVEYRDQVQGVFRRYWFSKGILCGGVLYGDISKTQSLTDWVLSERDYREIAGQL